MILVERLKEAKISVNRFLKVDIKKRAFEKGWHENLYSPEDLEDYPRWGIAGKDGLVLIDADNEEMSKLLREALPETLEVESPRRKLPHLYFHVVNGEVGNKILHLPKEKDAVGEIRAQNQYLVCPGTVISYGDLESGETKKGEYHILENRPIAKLEYKDFMERIKKYLGSDPTQKLTKAQMRDGVFKGDRHYVGIKQAAYLVGLDQDEITVLFNMKVWNKLCHPPLPESEIERMVKWAFEKQSARKEFLYLDPEGNTHFKPVNFAEYLMKKHHFKTTRDNETMFVFNEEEGIYGDWGKVVVKEQMATLLDEGNRARYVADVIHHIHGSTYFDRSHNPLGIIAVENGYLDVVTRELTPYTHELFIETKIPVKYDSSTKSPAILKFLEEVVGPDQMEILQEYLGYCLYKNMLFHKALLLVGDGSNGKTTFLNLLKSLLGTKNINNATLRALCYNRFATANLYGKLANICADIASDALNKTGMFKMLVGGDTVNAQKKFQKPFNFSNHAKLIFSANKVPDSVDDTLAFFRRWIIIECNNIFLGENKNPHILKELTTPTELSGLLNYALEGLKRLLKNGRFSETETMEVMKHHYIKHANSAKAFINDCLEYKEYNEEKGKNNYIETNLFYSAYIKFCQENNLRSMRKALLTVNMQQYMNGAVLTQIRKGKGKKQKRIRVWKNVTAVTGALSYFSNSISKEILHGQKRLVNGKTEEDKSEKVSKVPVTPVTATTCPLCNGLLPRDMSNTVDCEGKLVHKQCNADLMAGRIKP